MGSTWRSNHITSSLSSFTNRCETVHTWAGCVIYQTFPIISKTPNSAKIRDNGSKEHKAHPTTTDVNSINTPISIWQVRDHNKIQMDSPLDALIVMETQIPPIDDASVALLSCQTDQDMHNLCVIYHHSWCTCPVLQHYELPWVLAPATEHLLPHSTAIVNQKLLLNNAHF